MGQQYFTDAEWSTLLQAPIKAITAITLADKTDPVSFLKEARIALQILTDEQQQESSSDLVNALLSDLKSADAQETVQGEGLLLKKEFQFLGELQNFKDAAEGRTQSLDHLKQVSSILASKVTLKQAEEFRQWLLSVARKSAEAVKEGGIWGLGGERISSDEAVVLKKIEQALELKA